ncbi:MAG TPA: ferritin-like domain-containing protein [Verrucomicrobiae bacterium]|nr:ferritin-like domain-containing protein [Verrucomicrobiae bacterium]
MNSSDWLAYFRQNQLDRRGISWHEGIRLDPRLTVPLARSLARFQLGESSDGAHLRFRARRLAQKTGDAAYADAIELFIAEEQEHARLLAKVLHQLHAPLLRHHWSDWLFRRCRHLLGFYEEISVLLIAEIIALKYYGVIREGCRAPVLETVCEQILADEKFHVRFHCERFHEVIARRSKPVRAAWWWALTGMFAAACTVVAWDHRRAFRALGSSALVFLGESSLNFLAARDAIFLGVPFARGAAEQAPSGLSSDHHHFPFSPA